MIWLFCKLNDNNHYFIVNKCPLDQTKPSLFHYSLHWKDMPLIFTSSSVTFMLSIIVFDHSYLAKMISVGFGNDIVSIQKNFLYLQGILHLKNDFLLFLRWRILVLSLSSWNWQWIFQCFVTMINNLLC